MSGRVGTYVIRASGTNYFKVGVSVDVAKRLAGLQSACPLHLSCIEYFDGIDVEAIMHEMLSEYRLRGEWFDVDPTAVFDAIDAIRGMADGRADAPRKFVDTEVNHRDIDIGQTIVLPMSRIPISYAISRVTGGKSPLEKAMAQNCIAHFGHTEFEANLCPAGISVTRVA